MFVDIVGLPGAGKTSLVVRLEVMLQAMGHSAKGLRELSKEGIEKSRHKLRFIRNRPERTSLFGCFEYRRRHPMVFDLLCAQQEELPQLMLWSVDMLSQLYFAEAMVRDGAIALCDEGLLHRGVASFIGQTDYDGFDQYNRALPDDFVAVYLRAPVSLAIARAHGRANRLPVEKWYTGRDPYDVMHEHEHLISRAIAIRRERGLPVIDLDAYASVDANARLVTGAILAMTDAAAMTNSNAA